MKLAISAVFRVLTRAFSYVSVVSVISSGFAGILAAIFLYYGVQSIHLDVNQEFLETILVLSLSGWVLFAPVTGFLYGLFRGTAKSHWFSGVTSTFRNLNQFILIQKGQLIRNDLTPNELQKLLHAINFYPFLIAIIAFADVAFNSLVAIIKAYQLGFDAAAYPHLLIGSTIAACIHAGFTLILAELVTGNVRIECRRLLAEHSIERKSEFRSTVHFKLFLFVILYVIGLYISNMLTYYNRDNLQSVIYFILLTILLSIFFAYLIFLVIYRSLKQIEQAVDELRKGGRGMLFSFSIDKEFINVANGINNAAITIKDYQNNLEKKVKDRTRELTEAYGKLASKDAEIQVELDFAADIQKGIVPRKNLDSNGINFAVTYWPMGKVSGDYLDVFHFNESTFVLICDVSGHGVPAALITMAAKQAFSDAIHEDASPAEIFSKVNTSLLEKVKTQDYLTAFMIKIDKEKKVTYCNAGHVKAIYFKFSEQSFHFLDTNGLFIGAMSDAEASYENAFLQMYPKDRIFMYTDGLVEQTDKTGDPLGIDRILASLKEFKDTPVQQLHNNLEKIIREFHSNEPQKDDIAMLSIELTANWDVFKEKYNQGLIDQKSGNFRSALGHYQEALNTEGNYPVLYYNMARCYYQLKEFDLAEKYIIMFTELDPDEFRGFQLLTTILLAQGKKEAAADAARVLKELQPESEVTKKLLDLTGI